MKNELFLYQLIDSAFPTGSFSHSFGLETALKENKINTSTDLLKWMESYISANLAVMEGAAVYIAYQLIQTTVQNHEIPETVQKDLQRLDQKLTLRTLASESREGTIKIGRRYLNIVDALYPESGLEQYADWIKDGRCYGNPAVVHGWISAYLEVSADIAVFTHLYASVNNLLQSALRMTAAGQTDIQLILKELYPLIMEETEKVIEFSPDEDDLFNYAMAQEIEAMRHETLYSRLFMS